MKDRAYAKINLSLDIEGVREDGYHLINSIMIPIELWDFLEIEKAEHDKFECNVNLPFNDSNTIVKAINYIRETYNINDCFSVKLDKHTPSQAGLGGGSSDGAAALRILNRMCELNMSAEEIEKACVAIGSDVLFTYYNKPAQITGIGEKISFVEVKNSTNVLIVKPKEGVSTKQAYKELDLNTCDHPNIEKLKEKLKNGDDFEDLLANSLEEPAYRLCPTIETIKEELKKLGYNHPLMSGSGSTVFVLSNDYESLLKTRDILRKKYRFVYITKLKIE